jgi:hypothetical protein
VKLRSVHLAARAVTARDALVAQRDGGMFNVLINGKYQGDEMVERCRPAIVAELDRQIAEIDADLQALGVEVG